MTKEEAITKVRKIRRLANDRTTTHAEAESARRMADEICKKHNLVESDIARGAKAEAFDDLVARLDAYAKTRSEMPAAVAEVLDKLKREMKEGEKATALEKIVGVVRIASLFVGRAKMGSVKEIVEETLRRHAITV